MPGVKEDLSIVTIDAQHADDLAIFREVEGVIAVELKGVTSGRAAGLILIQISLSVLDGLILRHRHIC